VECVVEACGKGVTRVSASKVEKDVQLSRKEDMTSLFRGIGLESEHGEYLNLTMQLRPEIE